MCAWGRSSSNVSACTRQAVSSNCTPAKWGLVISTNHRHRHLPKVMIVRNAEKQPCQERVLNLEKIAAVGRNRAIDQERAAERHARYSHRSVRGTRAVAGVSDRTDYARIIRAWRSRTIRRNLGITAQSIPAPPARYRVRDHSRSEPAADNLQFDTTARPSSS